MNSNPKLTEKELNEVFLLRKKIGSYKSIPLDIKNSLLEYFLKSPYPNHQELEELSKTFMLPLVQIQNWFKYQRNRDFYHEQKAVKNYRRKHKFEKEERELLESAFRENSTLENVTLIKLQSKIKCKESYIIRWFSYRKKKLEKIKDKKNKNSLKHKKPQEKKSIVIADAEQEINKNIKIPENYCFQQNLLKTPPMPNFQYGSNNLSNFIPNPIFMNNFNNFNSFNNNFNILNGNNTQLLYNFMQMKRNFNEQRKLLNFPYNYYNYL